jgi:alpha-tubulin suppressor-like RCC1 family protein
LVFHSSFWYFWLKWENNMKTRLFFLHIAVVSFLLLTSLPSAVEAAAEQAPQASPLLGGPDLPMQSISAGWYHTCAILEDGKLLCWGDNSYGQTASPHLPVGEHYTQVSAGYAHTCGLRSDGSLLCWGWNVLGQANVPALPGGVYYTQVSTGYTHTCGLRSDGSLICWGDNFYFQSSVPALPVGLTYTPALTWV